MTIVAWAAMVEGLLRRRTSAGGDPPWFHRSLDVSLLAPAERRAGGRARDPGAPHRACALGHHPRPVHHRPLQQRRDQAAARPSRDRACGRGRRAAGAGAAAAMTDPPGAETANRRRRGGSRRARVPARARGARTRPGDRRARRTRRDFDYRPFAVAKTFDTGGAFALALDRITSHVGARQLHTRVASVDRRGRVVFTARGEAVPYDVLVAAPGARADPAVPGALTFAGPRGEHAVRALLAELDAGSVSSVAFVAPTGLSWTLPLYELALLTAAHLAEQGRRVASSLSSPTRRPSSCSAPR